MIKKVSSNYNTLKWVGVALLFLIALMIIASRQLNRKVKPIVKAQIKELLLDATDSLYHVEFSDITTNFFTGGASLTNVKITPDTNIFKKLILKKKAPNNLYYIELKELRIKHFHPFRIFRHKKLNIDLLLFDNPEIKMVNRRLDFNESKSAYSDKEPYEYISKYLKELRVKTIDFKNIRFKYVNNNLTVPEVDSVSNLNITLKDWLINKTSARDENRLYMLKDIIINLNDYTYATADSLYHINISHFDFKASTGKLNLQSLNVVPRYDEMTFGKVAGFAKDRFNIQMSDISLEGINLPLYIRRQELYATAMNITNGVISVFNNNELPRITTDKTGKFPHQLMQQLQAQLTVKQVNLNNIDVSYEEFDRDSKQKGKITFEKTSGTVTNITNAENVKARNPYMFINLSTYMMGKGKLDVRFKFNLDAKDGAFSYSGNLGEMDGDELNRITRPLGMILIKRGEVKQLEFDITANEDKAKGYVKFEFNDLSVALLKREKNGDRLIRKGLMSILANAMVINSDNPNDAGVLITAPINHKRVKTASFFNFVWKTLFQGIRHSVGITDKKEEQIRRKIASFEKIKADRDKRKAERQKRRAQRQGSR
ncbi:MAG: hypothetical protein EOO85_08210 [Pedobacter sp.]|nr:MAG: hypothetical protein EOO85_08210 [Pedobacter sp.]